MRLDKFLKDSYFGSRKTVKELIKKKRVCVNNQIILDEAYNIDPVKDIITLDNIEIKYEKYQYYLLNKPFGYITSTSSKDGKSIMDLFNDLPLALKNTLFPVGRLDKDTEGLIIITNDGDFCHKLTSPNHHLEKTYYIEHTGTLNSEACEIVKKQIVLETTTFLPSRLEIIDENRCLLTIKEGQYHQVKRMIHYLGSTLTYLKRISIANIKLPDDLKIGTYIKISENEIKSLIQ